MIPKSEEVIIPTYEVDGDGAICYMDSMAVSRYFQFEPGAIDVAIERIVSAQKKLDEAYKNRVRIYREIERMKSQTDDYDPQIMDTLKIELEETIVELRRATDEFIACDREMPSFLSQDYRPTTKSSEIGGFEPGSN